MVALKTAGGRETCLFMMLWQLVRMQKRHKVNSGLPARYLEQPHEHSISMNAFFYSASRSPICISIDLIYRKALSRRLLVPLAYGENAGTGLCKRLHEC